MIRLPVFGKDSLPHASSRVLSLCTTSLLWIIFIVCAIYIGPKKEQKVKYEIVQLVLSPEDHYIPDLSNVPEDIKGGKQGGEEIPEPEVQTESVPESFTPVEPAPVIQQPAQTKPVSKPAPAKTQPSKVPDTSPKPSETASSNSVPSYNYAQSIEDMMNTQMNNKPKDYSTVDWDAMFADTSTAQSSSTSTNKVVSQTNSYEGSAASSAVASSSNSTVNSTANSVNNTVSESTKDALSNLASATANTKPADRGTETKASISTQKGSDGKTQVEMSDGSTRALIYPSTIEIKFSPEASRAIEEDREITINFSVNENGNVFSVSLVNAAGLPANVRTEIENQIKGWRFESASNQSFANFKLKIIQK